MIETLTITLDTTDVQAAMADLKVVAAAVKAPRDPATRALRQRVLRIAREGMASGKVLDDRGGGEFSVQLPPRLSNLLAAARASGVLS